MKNGLRSHSIHQNTNTCQYTQQQHFSDKIPCIHRQHLQIESVEETYLLRLQIPCLSPSALWSLRTTTSASSGKYNYRAVEVRGWSTLDVCFRRGVFHQTNLYGNPTGHAAELLQTPDVHVHPSDSGSDYRRDRYFPQ